MTLSGNGSSISKRFGCCWR